MKFFKDEDIQKKLFLGTALMIIFMLVFNINYLWGLFIKLLGILFPFLMGLGIAFVLNVPMRAIEKRLFKKEKYQNEKWHGIRRACALVITILLAIIVITCLLYLVIPQLAETFSQLVKSIPEGARNLKKWAEGIFAKNPKLLSLINTFFSDWQEFLENLTDYLKSYIKVLLEGGISAVTGILSGAITFILGLVFSLYTLAQKEKLAGNVKKVLYAALGKLRADKVIGIAKITSRTFSNFISGQCTEALIICSIFCIFMTIFQMPYALLISIMISVMSLIPIVGSFIAATLGALIILMVSPVKSLEFLIMFIVLIQLESNLIYPRVVGNSVGLPGIWVLLSVSVGGSLFGVIGMIVFIPMVSVAYALFRRHIYTKLNEDNMLGEFDIDKNDIEDILEGKKHTS